MLFPASESSLEAIDGWLTLKTEPWSDCSVEEVYFFLWIVKKPSVLYSAGGKPFNKKINEKRTASTHQKNCLKTRKE